MAKRQYTGIRAHSGGIEIRWQINGARYSHFQKNKTPNDSNLRTAAALRKEFIESDYTGEDISGETFLTVAQSYIKSLDLEFSTASDYKGMLERYWLPALGNRPIGAIKYSELKGILTSLPVSGKTKQNALQPLRGVFALAVEDGLTSNPAERLKPPKHQRKDIDPVLPEEWSAISKHLSGDALDYFGLIWETGIRHPGEAVALTWEDVNLKDGTLRINKAVSRCRKKGTKTNRERTILLMDEALEIIKRLPTRFAGGPLFLNTEGNPICDGKLMNKHWRAALKAAEVRPRKAYALRHGFASIALTGGMEPSYVANYLGHSLEMLHKHYAKFIGQDNDRAALLRLHAVRGAILKSGEFAGKKARK